MARPHPSAKLPSLAALLGGVISSLACGQDIEPPPFDVPTPVPVREDATSEADGGRSRTNGDVGDAAMAPPSNGAVAGDAGTSRTDASTTDASQPPVVCVDANHPLTCTCVDGYASTCAKAGLTWIDAAQKCCTPAPASCSTSGSATQCASSGGKWTGLACCFDGEATCTTGTAAACSGAGKSWRGAYCCVDGAKKCVTGDGFACTGSQMAWTGTLCCVDREKACYVFSSSSGCANNLWTGANCCF